MRMDCECRIPGYHGKDDWVRVPGVFDTESAATNFARLMDGRDFELWLQEDEPRDVWVRKVGVTEHMVYSVSFWTSKQFRAEIKTSEQ